MHETDEATTLLRAAAAGDRDALAAFVRRTHDDVWRLCAHLVDPAAADDLAQEAFLRAVRAAPRFRGESSARTWLLAIARRVAADEIRARQRRRRRPGPPPERVVPDPAPAVDLHGLVAGIADTGQREAFVLTQVLGLRYAEAAEACGVAVGTIRSRVARARAHLAATLAADEAAGAEAGRVAGGEAS